MLKPTHIMYNVYRTMWLVSTDLQWPLTTDDYVGFCKSLDAWPVFEELCICLL